MKKAKIASASNGPLTKSTNKFPVVGVGASAGGLEAFKKLLYAIPKNSGIAYIMVQHLDPNHESLLPELLQKVTSIPVVQIFDDIKILPDHIYIIPSNKMLIVNDGKLKVSPRLTKKNERNLPIDLFFTSLAEVHQSHSIGVVLSGTASDGTLGLKAIKDHGGFTFAQNEASAAYGGMPKSAVQAGVVDFILPPEKIPAKILEITKITNGSGSDENNIPQQDEDVFKQILTLLRIRKGTDFTYYKQTTIRRRILRRMALNKNEEPAAYLNYLRENKPEQDILYQDLLIPVTEFFRDKKSFENLFETVFPNILKNKTNNDPVRIWVAGCSTGEEAYSIAICFKEFLGANNASVQIFATDISEPAIAKARTGTYKKSNLEALSAKRLNEFFIKNDEGYQLIKEVREMCVFAVHNFLKDPPFGKIDLISCRNALIYMEPYLQKKALTTFHYSLNQKGFLLLGKSETISSVPDLFSTAVKNDKLYSRKNVPGKFILVATERSEQNFRNTNTNAKVENIRTDFQKVGDDILLTKYTPAAVVVNEASEIVHFRGKTNDFLEQPQGKPTANLFKMAKQGLAFELRSILLKAKKEKAQVTKEAISMQANGSLRSISVEVIPLPNTIEPHYLVIFHETGRRNEAPDENSDVSNIKGKRSIVKPDEISRLKSHILRLENELTQTREDIRSITEDQEAANEELQSANEELLSGNEELQSLNEELETGKEELQITNEELAVINQEMTNLNEQMTAAKDYAHAIIATMHYPMLILDSKLRIKNTNEAFCKKFVVTKEETEGVLVYDLGNGQWNIPKLRKLLEDVLPQRTIVADYEVRHNFETIGERIMILNVREIINKPASEKSILLTIADVTEVRRLAIEVQLKEEELLKKEVTKRRADNAVLKKAVQEKTQDYRNANESLAAKNIELNNLNKELKAFNYVASHDLQEPLRKIQIFAGRILERENPNLSNYGKDMFGRMQEAAERMRTLIEDLLTFAKLGTAERKFEKTDISSVIEEVKKELEEAITAKNAVIEADKLCDVNINRSQFYQLMQNLISNALKFAKPKTPPHINIKCRKVQPGKANNANLAPNKAYCHIMISDNGIGFNKEYSEIIFEVFQKLHGKEEYAGSGIGLAIVKKIVENHNGIITATSELNKGARFDIYIPA